MKFRLVFSFILLILINNCVLAQRPNKIYGPAKEDKSIEYYQEQSSLWKAIAVKEPVNAEAWHYYYKAERARLQLEEPSMWSNNKDEFYEKLAPILNEAKKHIKGKFEYHLIKGLNTSLDTSVEELEIAFNIDPNRIEVIGWLFSYYIPLFDTNKCERLAKQMLNNNIYSDASLKWNYNALSSIAQNGVVISHGDMDGLPKYVLQYGLSVRKDVLVINKWLLATIEGYRKSIYNKIDLKEPVKKEKDFSNVLEFADFLAADVLTRVKRPSYISTGTPRKFIEKYNFEEKLFIVGNLLQFSETKINNIKMLEKNIFENYYLEYLSKSFQRHNEDSIVQSQMNLTYLPGLVLLREHYSNNSQRERLAKINEYIYLIVNQSGRKDEVESWFGI